MNIQKNARLTPRGRERIVRQAESGQTPQAVAEVAGVCPGTVRKWVIRFRAEGIEGLRDRRSWRARRSGYRCRSRRRDLFAIGKPREVDEQGRKFFAPAAHELLIAGRIVDVEARGHPSPPCASRMLDPRQKAREQSLRPSCRRSSSHQSLRYRLGVCLDDPVMRGQGRPYCRHLRTRRRSADFGSRLISGASGPPRHQDQVCPC